MCRQEVYKLLEEIWVTLGGMVRITVAENPLALLLAGITLQVRGCRSHLQVLMVWAIYVATNGYVSAS